MTQDPTKYHPHQSPSHHTTQTTSQPKEPTNQSYPKTTTYQATIMTSQITTHQSRPF